MTVGLKYPKPTREPKPRRPLRRKTWMRKKAPRRLSRSGSDPDFLAWVRTRPCFCCGVDNPFIAIHAHHAGRRPGVGLKAPDDTAIPLCEICHRAWHDGLGAFIGLSRFERFAWSMRAIAETQASYRAGTPEVSRGPR